METARRAGGIPAWVVVTALGLLAGLQPLTTDMYLPALPQMQQGLGLSPGSAQWTLSVLILAFGVGQLVWGPVSDRFGRQPVLRWGLGLYTLSSVAATFAINLETMLLARIAQGACLSAAVVCGRAMVRDLYAPEEGAKMMARGMTGLGLLALLGPILGGLSATHGGWRLTLGLLVVFGGLIWLFLRTRLPETLPSERRAPGLNWPRQIQQWLEISKHPTFRAHAMLTSCTYGGLYVYLALSPFVFIELLHMGRTAFGASMATLSLSYLVGTLFCRRWLPRHGLLGTVRLAGWCSLAGGVWMALVSAWQASGLGGVHPLALLPGLWLYAFAHGIHQPCGQTGVVAAFPTRAGAASALSGFVLSTTAFVVGAMLSWWTSLPAWTGTPYPMTLGIALGAALTAWTALRRVQHHGLAPQAT
jgi:DHA1 family bicyclomycin/chloramphenicol resistance-like MFS transporter